MIPKYLMDENLDPLYREQLLKQDVGLIVWSVGDPGAPKKGTLDPEILIWCEDHDFVLVTKNRSSMRPHLDDHLALGRSVPGIIILSPRQSVGETIEELVLLALASLENEFRNQIIFLPHTG
jgi:predicted nuclease of predicted toxin-antitoxin system